MRKVGYVVGEAGTNQFTFVSDKESFPPRLEYLVLRVIEKREGLSEEKEILAQVVRLSNISEIFGQDLTLKEVESILNRFATTPQVLGTARVIGFLEEEEGKRNVRIPRCAPLPGQEVFLAEDDFLSQFFSHQIEAGIRIGNLIHRKGVEVLLDPNGFRRHVAIIAQTGAGKSYLSGLVLENLLALGGTILVFDPNSDYVCMRRKRGGGMTEFAKRITIYRPRGVEGRRFSDEHIGGSKEYTVRFKTLDDEEIFEILGITDKMTNIRAAIHSVRSQFGGEYLPKELKVALESMANDPNEKGEMRDAARKAARRMSDLINMGIWGFKDIEIEECLAPMRMSVVDLAGIPKRVSEFLVQRTLADLWGKASSGTLPHPVFVVLEEAHNFVPGEHVKCRSRSIINTLASEGRKFAVFLIVVTQRPHKIDDNTLSQCNSQIIMRLTNPEDMSAVSRASEAVSQDLLDDLPGLNVGEAVVVGQLTRTPVIVKVSGRVSEEGGSDINVIEELAKARRDAETDTSIEKFIKEDLEELREAEA